MKKILVCFLLALGFLSASAQPSYRHQISLSYGRLSNSELYGIGVGELAKIIAPMVKQPEVQVVSSGSFTLSYFYRLSNMVSLGGLISYVNFMDAKSTNKTLFHYGTVLAGVTLHWYEREWFRTYSTFAVGTLYQHDPGRKGFRFAGHATLLGLEVGKRFCGFLDLGVGDLGVAAAGLRLKW